MEPLTPFLGQTPTEGRQHLEHLTTAEHRPASARAQRDEVLIGEIERICAENCSAYGGAEGVAAAEPRGHSRGR